MSQTEPPRYALSEVTVTPFGEAGAGLSQPNASVPSSQTWGTANRVVFYPVYPRDPFTVSKAFWCNGATVGTDYIDIGIYRMTDPVTGRMDLIRSTGAVLSKFASVVQESTWTQVQAVNVTNGSSSVDATSYTTASVTLVAGRLYLMAVENSAAAADAVSSIDGGPTFTSRSSTAYNTNANRTSIWSAVPTVNYTGTLVINFGAATETGCCWSLDEFSNVDTATTDGIVQQATGAGSGTTMLATLAAFSSVHNVTYGVHGHAANTGATPKSGWAELDDLGTATPAQSLETEWIGSNDTAVSATISTAAWGSCAVEIKAAAHLTNPWRVARTLLTNGNDSTDRSSGPGYTTASVTLKQGRLYLMAVENSHGTTAAAVSAITGGGTWTSRATTQYNTNLNRVSLFSCVPVADYTGTIDIAFGATQTGCVWSLTEMSGVDTTTNDGVVQTATGTGNSTTPLATLAAFGSVNNATFACHANVGDSTTTPSAGWTELSDDGAATPAQYLETQWRQDPDEIADATITSGQWGSIACEVKASTAAFVIPPAAVGRSDIYMAFAVNGTTARFLRSSPGAGFMALNGALLLASTFPLPSTCIATAAGATNILRVLAGFSRRSLLG